ncbi:hypothetical protein [Lamprobacter modestohalophilus]|uniref:hypothetical protein n=1 Tax=Lamprobacter modestohalophilus TaxID=1064514 RepID=UPI003B845C0D
MIGDIQAVFGWIKGDVHAYYCVYKKYPKASQLFSIVAWDQVSWPGNDYWGGARMTDDEVKAAASDLMCAITGTEGADEARSSGYQPPAPCATWLASQANAHAVAGASRRRLRSTSV